MKRLFTYLDGLNSCGSAATKLIEERIWADYGVEKVVLILDMSGFSRIVRSHGIVHFLAMVRRMQLLTRPIVQAHGGQNLKYEADNLFATFDDVNAAVDAAIMILNAFTEQNRVTEDSFDIAVSIGIDKGLILLVPGRDMFGDAVNVASKLGEDLCPPGEILVSAHAAASLKSNPAWRSEERTYTVSDLTIKAVALIPSGVAAS